MTTTTSRIKNGDHYDGKVYCGHCDLFVAPSAFNAEFVRCEKCMDTTRSDEIPWWERTLVKVRWKLPPDLK